MPFPKLWLNSNTLLAFKAFIDIRLPFTDYPSKATGELVQCSNCGRGFAKERIETHTKICTSTKERKVYNVAKMRIEGTEAGALYNAGE